MYFFILILLAAFTTTQPKPQNIDLLLINAKIYTVNQQFDIAEAVAVHKGKILETGQSSALAKKYAAAKTIDLKGKTVYPGFIDAHAHFFRYGEGLQTADLTGTESWQQILDTLQSFAKTHPDGWLIGRGWDQNDWQQKSFPDFTELNRLFPNRPVLLTRVDGHAAMVNQKALDLANIKAGQTLTGGEIKTLNGKLTGLLIDNAVDLVSAKIPPSTKKQAQEALLAAQKNCFAVGLTTVDDCGLDYEITQVIDEMQQAGSLKMRLYVMLADAQKNYDYLFKKGRVKTSFLNVRSFKVYGDGALGSRGACLLEPYHDDAGKSGFLLSDRKHFMEVAEKIAANGFQMCTHAIGDSANREILNIYASVLKGKNDKRWRIEHAQVVNPKDFKLFGDNNIIPSVQPTHATSDMYWAGERLGTQRLKSAYAYQQLLKENNWLPLGTDFPVEDINPMFTFYAAVARKDNKAYPDAGFQKENALTREQALKGMTIWAAKSNFEEQEKGSIEKGKFADFVVLNDDIMQTNEANLPSVKVLYTFVNGQIVYQQ